MTSRATQGARNSLAQFAALISVVRVLRSFVSARSSSQNRFVFSLRYVFVGLSGFRTNP